MRYLIRAAAIKSANDAATAIGEGLAGSEQAFAQQMTQMARALGMNNTNFRNAHGLTQEGHYSTAHDMTILGRRLFYDFPQYYNIFSRRSADAGIAQVSSTNKRFLDSYQGADGIKTGYTRAAGFNLTASAQRGNKRLVATVLGGTSTAHRNQVMAQLLDAGFNRVPNQVREVRPDAPRLLAQRVVRRAQVEPNAAAMQTDPQRLVLAASAPPARVTRTAAASTTAAALAAPPPPAAPLPAEPARQDSLALTASARPLTRRQTAARPEVAQAQDQAQAPEPAAPSASLAAPVLAQSDRPTPAPRSRSASTAAVPDAPAEPVARPTEVAETSAPRGAAGSLSLVASPAPKPRSETVILAAMGEGDLGEPEALEIVRRPVNSGRSWGVTLGLFTSKAEAERLLLRSALEDGALLEGAARHVADTRKGFQPGFANLTKASAELVCDRFASRSQECRVVGR